MGLLLYIIVGGVFAILGYLTKIVKDARKKLKKEDEIPEKYQTGRWETDLGNGRKRITRRININDLVDNPELAKTLFED